MKLISGMHRSGTSMMARLCKEAGGDLGDPTTFYAGDQWNPDGYFEQPDIHRINMPLVNGPWGKLSYFKLPSTSTILKRSDQLSELIKEMDQKYKGCIVKETRFCLTLPAWRKHGATIDKILFCLRSPNQVAGSIQKRNKTILRHGLELWFTHNTRLVQNIKEIPVHFVSYSHLLNPNTSFNELKSAFHFMEISIDDDRIKHLISTYIKTGMNHHQGLEVNYPKKIELLWNELQQKHHLQNKKQ